MELWCVRKIDECNAQRPSSFWCLIFLFSDLSRKTASTSEMLSCEFTSLMQMGSTPSPL